MAKKILPIYKCTQQALYSVCETEWNSCSANLAAFTAYKAKYIAAYITAKLDAIIAAKALPDVQQRGELSETERIQLGLLRDACTADFQDLKGYIEDGFPEEEWKARFDAAGQQYYRKASAENWENVTGMNTSMNAFIDNNTAALTTGGMPATFQAKVTTDTGAFQTKYNSFKTSRETGVATGAKISANNDLYRDVQDLNRDAKRVFRNDAEMQKLFTFQAVLNLVAPPGSASLKVTVTKPDNSPAPDAQIVLNDSGNNKQQISVNTDANGIGKFTGIDPDSYVVNISLNGFTTVTVNKDVDTGTDARLSVKLEGD